MHISRLVTLMTTSALCAFLATQTARAAGASSDDASSSSEAPQTHSLSGAYLAAKSAQLAGDLDMAADFFSRALALDPTSSSLQQDAMFAFLADGDFQGAVDLAAKQRDTEDAGKVARIALGVDAIAKGDFASAINELDIKEPSDLDALLVGELTAWAEVGSGRTDAALSRLDQLNSTPWYAVFNNYQKGLLAEVANRTDVARTAFGKVVDNPESVRTSPDAFLGAVESLARLESRDGKKDAALKAIDAGLKVVPTYDPLIQLKNRMQKGETIEPSVSSVQDGAAEALYILGQAVNRGDGEQVALLYFQLARALEPRNPALLTALAGLAERANRYDQAIEYYRQIPQSSAYRRTAELQIGLDLWSAEKKSEAKDHLQQAIKDYPNDIEAFTALADVMSADKDYDQAADALNKAIDLANADGKAGWNLYYQRGIAYERTKHWDKAEPDFKKALELSPNQPQVLNYLGYSWVDMNENLDEGLQMIKTAVELRPNDGYIIDSLGWAYYRLGRYDEAVEQLERAVLLTPMDPTINEHLGDAYWRVGRKREAKFQWERALIGEPKPDAETISGIQSKLQDGMQPVTRKVEATPDNKGSGSNSFDSKHADVAKPAADEATQTTTGSEPKAD